MSTPFAEVVSFFFMNAAQFRVAMIYAAASRMSNHTIDEYLAGQLLASQALPNVESNRTEPMEN